MVIVIVLALIGAVTGVMFGSGGSEALGLVAGIALGVLGGKVLGLQSRLNALQRQLERQTSGVPATVAVPQPTTPPPELAPSPYRPPPELLRPPRSVPEPRPAVLADDALTLDAELTATAPPSPKEEPAFQWQPDAAPSMLDTLVSKVTGFFLTGNPIVRIGVVVLFFGVAFLLKYAADQNLFPIELRLAGVAAAGIGLAVLGWRLRERNRMYALVVQGGGIGILYLTVFAAARLYGVIPMGFAFALMVVLVAVSVVLAVVQNGAALAAFGFAGGFLAPILASTGEGSHVALFSYYLVLDLGIFAIAWYRSWRSLNLLGFLFTFIIGLAWGHGFYTPAFFASVEPFLLAFFGLFLAIGVLFAHKQPPRLRGLVDGTLVFGTPLVGFGLQAALVQSTEYGLAWSAAGLAVVYGALARSLWNHPGGGLRTLTQAYTALAVGFATLAIPLAVDGRWTAAAWALEGAGLLWVGMRQRQLFPRLAGVALQVLAAPMVALELVFASRGMPVLNMGYLATVLMAGAGLFSAWCLHREGAALRGWERPIGTALLAWGLLWWFGGAAGEVGAQLAAPTDVCVFALLVGVTAAGLAWLGERLHWPQAGFASLVAVPLLVLLGAIALERGAGHALPGWSVIPWVLTGIVLYRQYYRREGDWPASVLRVLHPLSAWLLVCLATVELHWWVATVIGAAATWSLAAMVLPGLLTCAALLHPAATRRWPVAAYTAEFHELLVAPLLLVLAWGSVVLMGSAGDPGRLAYVPVLNPLDLMQCALPAIGLLFWWRTRGLEHRYMPALADGPVFCAVGTLAFLTLNTVIARSVHHWTGVAYHIEALWVSGVFQSTIAVVWTVSSLALVASAARLGLRMLWFAGAGLLAAVVLKLFLVDLSSVGTLARIVSFLAVGGLTLVIGYFSPLPPRPAEEASGRA